MFLMFVCVDFVYNRNEFWFFDFLRIVFKYREKMFCGYLYIRCLVLIFFCLINVLINECMEYCCMYYKLYVIVYVLFIMFSFLL